MANRFKIVSYEINQEGALSNACREGNELWKWAMEEKYKELPVEELIYQLVDFGVALKTAGEKSELKFVKIINDAAENMPSDARVDFLYKPTYVAAAVFMYAYNNYPQLFREQRFADNFKEICKASMGRSLMGHGYECMDDLKENLLLFEKAGAKVFIKNKPAGLEEFCQMLEEYYRR